MKLIASILGLSVRFLLWLLSLAGGYALIQWLMRDRSAINIDMVAHRGGALEAPETTAAAYRNALDLGYTALELDIQLSKDGEIIAFHDETLNRTTNGHGPLRDKTLAELKELDAGSWFGEKWRGEQILTFREVIDIAKSGGDGGVRLMLEIKSPHLYPGIEEKMIMELEDTGYMRKVTIMCFDADSLDRVRDLRPQLPLLYLFAPPTIIPSAQARRAEVFGPYWKIPLLLPTWIRIAHEGGRRVYVWTVNDAWAMRLLRYLGVDGVITDRPTLLREVYGADQPVLSLPGAPSRVSKSSTP